MKKISLLLLILIANISFSQNSVKNFIDQPYIEVTGKSETEITPNEIFIHITINENDKKGKTSVEDQENQMIKILESLSLDLEKNFSILDFNGYFNRKFLGNNEVLKAKRYQLKVNNGATLGKVFEALDSIDISNISIAKTSHTDIESLTRKNKLKALKLAKEKAIDYANAIEQNIGKAIFIQEQNTLDISMLEGPANGVTVRGAGYYNSSAIKTKIQNLNLKNIIITSTVNAKFILN